MNLRINSNDGWQEISFEKQVGLEGDLQIFEVTISSQGWSQEKNIKGKYSLVPHKYIKCHEVIVNKDDWALLIEKIKLWINTGELFEYILGDNAYNYSTFILSEISNDFIVNHEKPLLKVILKDSRFLIECNLIVDPTSFYFNQ